MRPSNIVQENLVGRRVGRLRTAIYASRSYLKKNTKKKEWAAHDWVAPEETLSHLTHAKWMRENILEDHIVVRVDSLVECWGLSRFTVWDWRLERCARLPCSKEPRGFSASPRRSSDG